jgi:two-component system, OmpR family, phosphate regulon sensor histidine kinase PhoR
MFERKSLKWPIFLAIIMIVLLIVLTVGWILITIFGANWILLSVGSIMFGFVLTGVVLYLVWSIQQINLNRRQSNFIDAVTHELKSPIASLKLFLQTLGKRNIDEIQRHEFYRSMLDDVDRLDQLITQLLDVARLQQNSNEPESEAWVPVDLSVNACLDKLLPQHSLDSSCVKLDCPPIDVWAKRIDIEVLIRNLIDNAFKYAGRPAQVEITIDVDPVTLNSRWLISDNGTGVPRHLRRQVFHRFYRIGNELERTKPGTGLGLFLVRSIVKRLKGTIRVLDVPKRTGARFEVMLPNSRLRSDSDQDRTSKEGFSQPAT